MQFFVEIKVNKNEYKKRDLNKIVEIYIMDIKDININL